MEDLVDPAFWPGKRVFLTGHTGFKGGWLTLWLHALGAEVHGYSLAPDTTPNLFTAARIASLCHHTEADIRNPQTLLHALQNCTPDIVFHLAAQPLVRASYTDPLTTFSTNVQGTANLLEAVRQTPTVQATVVITTDKVYLNHEREAPYQESDPLGGYDPYSSSKAAAELVAAAYRQSYALPIATARAGNVIGGGDWSQDRLIPDLIRNRPQTTILRNPGAIRPWQHVLDPLAGYLRLAQLLCTSAGYAQAFNFGPAPQDTQTVAQIAQALQAPYTTDPNPSPHEAQTLKLDSTKAHTQLLWHPRLRLPEALAWTQSWYAAHARGEDMQAQTLHQIKAYSSRPTKP